METQTHRSSHDEEQAAKITPSLIRIRVYVIKYLKLVIGVYLRHHGICWEEFIFISVSYPYEKYEKI